MKRLLKFLHQLGAFGMMGALAGQLVLVQSTHGMSPVELAAVRQGILLLSQWLLLPSITMCLMSGFIAMALHPPFHNARWAWVKALFGSLMLEGTLGAVQGTARRAAELSARAAAGHPDHEAMADALRHERGGLLAIGFLCLANVALAVWRPRLRG